MYPNIADTPLLVTFRFPIQTLGEPHRDHESHPLSAKTFAPATQYIPPILRLRLDFCLYASIHLPREKAPRESRSSIPAHVPTSPTVGDASIAVPATPSSSPSPVLTARTQPRTRLRAAKEPSSSVESTPLSDSTPSALNVHPRSQLHPFHDPNATVPSVEGNEVWTPDRNINSLIGAKRRYASMAMESTSSCTELGLFGRPPTTSIVPPTSSAFPSLSTSSTSTGTTSGPFTRRRLRERSSRNNLVGSQHTSPVHSTSAPSLLDAMDVEDEQGGRERKRIARR